jgi:hypothetical protein
MNKLIASLVAALAFSAFAQGKAPAPAADKAPAEKPAEENNSNTFRVAPGESLKLSVRKLSRATQSDGNIADIDFRYGSDDVTITGRREGSTTVTFWSGETKLEYRVVVAKK